MAVIFATLACGLPTPATVGNEPNFEATLLAVTISALEQTQNAPTAAAPTNDQVAPQVPTNTLVPNVPTATTAPSKPMLSVSVNTNCRSGPGLKYPITGSILIHGSFEVVAQAPDSTPYVIIRNPDGGADCWAWLEHATVTGTVSSLPILAIPPVPLGSISGLVWLEDCDDVNPANTGCVNDPNSGLPEGDGAFNNEVLLAGITVELFSGQCSSNSSLLKVMTDSNGYKFNNLEAGTYCVVVDTFKHGNDSILIQNFGGIFTFPDRSNTVQSFEVDLLPGKHVSGFNFGWDDFEQ